MASTKSSFANLSFNKVVPNRKKMVEHEASYTIKVHERVNNQSEADIDHKCEEFIKKVRERMRGSQWRTIAVQ